MDNNEENNLLKDLLDALAKELAKEIEENPQAQESQEEKMAKLLDGATEIQVVGSLPKLKAPSFGAAKQGQFVTVRPAGERYGNRTFLGVYLGDMPLASRIGRRTGSTVIEVSLGGGFGNPCIWVPDLNQLVYGMESWWGAIKSPEELRQITNDDINNVWYVRAAKELGFEPSLQPDPTEN